MTSWFETVPSVELTVTCGGSRHRLRWERGALVPLDHPDLASERALIAFGGDVPVCVELCDLWAEAVADGGFLAEWVDERHLSPARRSWLGTALERMASQGFHEFLHHLPTTRAGRMGRFVHAFPGPFLDRAAATVAAEVADGGTVVCDQAHRHLIDAAGARLRQAFVRAVGGRQLSIGSAALAPLTTVIEPEADVAPRAQGALRGPGHRIELAVGPRWLHTVWAPGAAVVDGHLVLARRDEGPGSLLADFAVVDWSTPDEALQQARVSWRTAAHDGAWHLLPAP